MKKDRRNIRDQLNEFNRSVGFMKHLEKEIPGAIKEINVAEEKQRQFRRDLSYLEGERAALIYEKENFEFSLNFIRNFSFVLCMLFGITTVGLLYLLLFRKINVIKYIGASIILIIIVSTVIYAFRRHILRELSKNAKKRSRIIKLINKKTVMYAHYTNFLNYEYSKFRIKNSEMLKDNLNEYNSYKHLVARQDSIRSIMYQTEEELEDFMKEKKLYMDSSSVERLANNMNMDEQIREYRKLYTEKESSESSLEFMDERHAMIWNAFTKIAEESTSEILDKLMEDYMTATEKLISRKNIVKE